MTQNQKKPRPLRVRVRNELGFLQSLPEHADCYARFGAGPDVLRIGAGPAPGAALLETPPGRTWFMECPELRRALSIPPDWIPVRDLDDWLQRHGRTGTILLYTPGIRLFPSFYTPLAARVRKWFSGFAQGPEPSLRTALVCGQPQGLIAREAEQAFQEHGFRVRPYAPRTRSAELCALLKQEIPALFVSINFNGLDPYGEAYHLLRAASVPVAVWCVDNPWHLLSALRAPFWKECFLFVTDGSFIPGLEAHGAARVRFLPLAGSPAVFRVPERASLPALERIVFAGRTAFPGKAGFFAGCGMSADQASQMRALLEQGLRPDFLFWAAQTRIERLWPGNAVRQPGFLAEESGRAWRELCVRAAAAVGVSVFGDPGWAGIVPPERLHAPVDYYATLPAVYRAARFSLSLTSLLLPAGLNQRHFDVWLADGFLLTDATPGLTLFPERLTREIRFETAADLAPLTRRLERDPRLYADLKTAWKQEILRAHTYAHRIQTILETVGLG